MRMNMCYRYHACRYMYCISTAIIISSVARRTCVYVCVDVCLLCEPYMYTYIYKYQTCIMHIDVCIIAVLPIAVSHGVGLTKCVLL